MNIVALTGAGISKASGLPTFVDRPELKDNLTGSAWNMRPWDVWRTIREFHDMIKSAKPNAAHTALAKYNIPIITQNIDGLHQAAGSETVIELHGNVGTAHCLPCMKHISLDEIDHTDPRCPHCGFYMKPDVVLYGEPVNNWDIAESMVDRCDLLLIIGTSMLVYPAASLVDRVLDAMKQISICNQESEINIPLVLEGLMKNA